MFFPGETIIHKFVIPFEAIDISYVVVSYKQGDDIVFEKTITSGFEEEETNQTSFSFAFTQQESLRFSDNWAYTIQCNVYTKGGSRHTSNELKSSNGIQYLREVMSDAE